MKKLLLLSIILTFFYSFTLKAQDYKIIVNNNNPVNELSKKEISYYFLKKRKYWPNRVLVQPIDLNTKSPIRKKFTRDIHHKTVVQVRAYWQQAIFAGRATPTREIDSEDAVIDFVKKHKGAIAYVSKNKQTKGVKTIKIK